jgi:protein involved in polysaccharide export with SLBB domain
MFNAESSSTGRRQRVGGLLLRLALTLAFGAAAVALPQPALAQITTAQPSSADILRRLSESGMSREQVRQRLMQMGYDPALADPYLDQMSPGGVGAGAALPAPSDEFVLALQRMGLLVTPRTEPVKPSEDLSLRPGDTAVPVPAQERPPEAAPETLRVFGTEMFSQPTTRFQTVETGPVDPGYRVGPGDEVRLMATGGIEMLYGLRVDREGYVVVPDVGRVLVNGLTLEEVEQRLYAQLGRAFSGVQTGAIQVAVSLGELRTNQVFVLGEVQFQGGYQVSSLATLFHALHTAGGPKPTGSFRSIQVRRDGQVIREIDLYQYLLSGNSSDDIRLLQGDIVFVPLAGPQVAVSGRVRRNAIFELKDGEDLRDALGFAGGFEPDARVDQLHVYRILPPEARTGTRDRVLVDVSLAQLQPDAGPVPVFDRDSVVVRDIRAERANVVVVEGQVERPGPYEFRDGMSIWELVDRAGGLLPDAFLPRAHVIRTNPADSTFTMQVASLERGPNGEPVDDLRLQDQDRIVVYGRPRLEVPKMVSIEGFVKEPGAYPLSRGMTVEDLILAAGGYREGADGVEAEVSRLRLGLNRTDSISTTTLVSLGSSIPWPYDGRVDRSMAVTVGRRPSDDGAAPLTGADEFVLDAGDRVFVRQLPGYVEPSSVVVTGEVMRPGPYPLTLRDERLSSVLARAGGVTEDGYVEGARLVRDSVLVGIDLERILDDPGSAADLTLQPGDQLEIPKYDPTVTVTGAVAFSSRIPYQRGRSMSDYLAEAGGTVHDADRGRAIVEYANGSRAITRRTLGIRRDPEVRPGATIRVPFEEPGQGTNWDVILTKTLTITGTLATVILAVKQF